MEATTASTVALSIAVEAGRLTCDEQASDKEGRATISDIGRERGWQYRNGKQWVDLLSSQAILWLAQILSCSLVLLWTQRAG